MESWSAAIHINMVTIVDCTTNTDQNYHLFSVQIHCPQKSH